MKKILIAVLIAIPGIAFSQKEISLSAYESAKIASHKKFQAELLKAYRYEDSTHYAFLRDFFVANKIPLNKISEHPDSLKIETDKIKLILKK